MEWGTFVQKLHWQCTFCTNVPHYMPFARNISLKRFVFLYILARSISILGEFVVLLFERVIKLCMPCPSDGFSDSYCASCNPGTYAFFSMMLRISATINTMIV